MAIDLILVTNPVLFLNGEIQFKLIYTNKVCFTISSIVYCVCVKHYFSKIILKYTLKHSNSNTHTHSHKMYTHILYQLITDKIPFNSNKYTLCHNN